MESTRAQRLMAGLLRKEKLQVEENVLLPGGEADLFLPDFKVIVELDGFFHLSTESQQLDERKSRIWREEGYQVFRFTNESVYRQPENCIEDIRVYIRGLKKAIREIPSEVPLKHHEGLQKMHSRLKNEERSQNHGEAWQKKNPEAYFLSLSPEGPAEKNDRK